MASPKRRKLRKLKKLQAGHQKNNLGSSKVLLRNKFKFGLSSYQNTIVEDSIEDEQKQFILSIFVIGWLLITNAIVILLFANKLLELKKINTIIIKNFFFTNELFQ